MVRKSRIVKTALVVLAACVVIVAVHLRLLKNDMKDMDNLFSGILMDHKGYYFPSSVDDQSARGRSLEEMDSVGLDTIWSYDWKQDVGASAAVGAYYIAKGFGLTNYYKSEDVSAIVEKNELCYMSMIVVVCLVLYTSDTL